MRGDLVETTAADVCRELAAQGASGILAIDGPGGPGRVVLVDGRIIAAVSPTPRARLGDRLVGAGELDPDDLANALAAQQDGSESLPLGSLLVERGLVRRDAVRVFVQEQVLDALFEVIRWRYGAFAFETDDVARGQGVPLSLSVDDALVEVARRQQEWNELSQVIPDLDSVPSFRTGGATATAALEPDEFAVLASVDGTRSVRALAADLGYGEFEAARIVYGLTLLGVVDVRPPQDEIGAALEDALGLGDFEDVPPTEPPRLTAVHDPVEHDGGQEQTADDVAHPAPPLHAAEQVEESDPPDATDEQVPAPPAGTDPPDDTDEQVPAPPAGTDPTDDTDEQVPEPPAAAVPAAEAADTTDIDDRDDFAAFDDVEVPFTEPAPPPSPEERIGPHGIEPTPTDDVPEVWVASTDEDERPAASDDQDDGAGQVLDAEVDLPSGATEPEPSDDAEEDAPSWQELATAAEQAASDPEGERHASTPQPQRPAPPGAATTGPEPGSEAPPEERPAAAAPQRGDDNDVSEFLRELSRLSVDPPSSPSRPKPPKRPSPPSTGSGDQDNKKKRRGLFGRG